MMRDCLLPLLAVLATACNSPHRQAMRELATAGIEPTGQALVAAVGRCQNRTVELLLLAGVHTEQRDPAGRTPLRIAVDRLDSPMVDRLLAAQANPNATTPDGASVLAAAVAKGEPILVETLLRAGARPDGHMADGEKILPWAIREGRLELVRLMMRAGADPHLRDRQGNPLLHVAIASGRRDLAETLIALGADPGAINPAGEGTIHLALRREWLDFIAPLTAAGADPNAPDPTGTTPLQQAVGNRDLGRCALLLQCGADPNTATATGLTPLQIAVRTRHAGLCALLLDRGADPNAPDPAGMTPLGRAVTLRDTAMLELMLRHRGTKPGRHEALTGSLLSAIGARWPEGMELLVAAGASPDARDASGRRLAETACADNDAELLGWLLDLGAQPALRDHGGRLLVERAAAAGRGSLVKLLLDYGSPAGRALYDACIRQDRQMARLLLACGVAPGVVPGPQADTPLAAAIRAGDDELAATLAGLGGAVNHRLPEGQTVLHLAIVKGCHRTVKLLLEAGANPNHPVTSPVSEAFIRRVRPGPMASFLRNDRNLTPLMLAADAGVPQTVQHLLAAGAKRNVWSRSNHFWPINFAAQRGDVKVMRTILGQDPEHEERRIVISLSAQQARMYDASGREVFTTKVSTGRKGYATRTGDFVITDKNRTWTSTIYHASMPYFLRLSCSDFGLHQGYVPGYPASHGCIRVPAGKAAELFRLTEPGDRVQIIP